MDGSALIKLEFKEEDKPRGEEQDEGESADEEVKPKVPSICPICRACPANPIQIHCDHIFCFLCIKGVYETSGVCPMCRSDIGIDFNRREHRVLGAIKLPTSSSGYYWFYEGHGGWWLYDAETNASIEEAYEKNKSKIEAFVAGNSYVINLKSMSQYQKYEPGRKRKICRESLALDNIRGLSGLKGEVLKRALDMMRFADDVRI